MSEIILLSASPGSIEFWLALKSSKNLLRIIQKILIKDLIARKLIWDNSTSNPDFHGYHISTGTILKIRQYARAETLYVRGFEELLKQKQIGGADGLVGYWSRESRRTSFWPYALVYGMKNSSEMHNLHETDIDILFYYCYFSGKYSIFPNIRIYNYSFHIKENNYISIRELLQKNGIPLIVKSFQSSAFKSIFKSFISRRYNIHDFCQFLKLDVVNAMHIVRELDKHKLTQLLLRQIVKTSEFNEVLEMYFCGLQSTTKRKNLVSMKLPQLIVDCKHYKRNYKKVFQMIHKSLSCRLNRIISRVNSEWGTNKNLACKMGEFCEVFGRCELMLPRNTPRCLSFISMKSKAASILIKKLPFDEFVVIMSKIFGYIALNTLNPHLNFKLFSRYYKVLYQYAISFKPFLDKFMSELTLEQIDVINSLNSRMQLIEIDKCAQRLHKAVSQIRRIILNKTYQISIHRRHEHYYLLNEAVKDEKVKRCLATYPFSFYFGLKLLHRKAYGDVIQTREYSITTREFIAAELDAFIESASKADSIYTAFSRRPGAFSALQTILKEWPQNKCDLLAKRFEETWKFANPLRIVFQSIKELVFSDDIQQIEPTFPNNNECAICFNEFLEPFTLACGHTFCRNCLKQQYRHRQDPSCALCRRCLPSLEVFNRSIMIYINNELEMLAQKNTQAI